MNIFDPEPIPDATSRGTTPDPKPSTPPANLDAEQALLGGLLFDNEIYHRLSDFLTESAFYDPVHGRIYAIAAEMISKGNLADGITLKTRFERDVGLAELDAMSTPAVSGAYLADLLDKAAPGPLAVQYAKLVYDLFLRRELIRVAGEIEADARDPEMESDGRGQMELAEQRLYAVSAPATGRGGFAHVGAGLKKAVEMAAAAYERGDGVSGLPTGLRALDGALGGLHASDLIVLAGRPSMGKTALGLNIAYNIAKAYQFRQDEAGNRHTAAGGVVGFFSLEMSADQLATRLLSDWTGIGSSVIKRGKFTPIEFEHIRDAQEHLEKIPLHIDQTGSIGIHQLASRARRLKRTKGLDVVVVDYLQLCQGSDTGRRDNNRVQEVSEITVGLKSLAKELDVPVLALSQLSRQTESRPDKRPMLSDLRESGSIEQDADVVMFVYREEYYLQRTEPRAGTPEHAAWEEEMQKVRDQAEIIIGKARHGTVGTVKMHFDGPRTRFTDLERFA